MDPDIKAEWIKRLRSGRYNQGTGWLRRYMPNIENESIEEHCCLGVLCDIAVEQNITDMVEITAHDADEGDRIVKAYKHHKGAVDDGVRYTSMPPTAVQVWAGIDGDVCNELAALNDNDMSFKEIADNIERHL